MTHSSPQLPSVIRPKTIKAAMICTKVSSDIHGAR
nr:MAG TPA: hypothetical protein [Caudoviricetes sp.]DAK00530.1 MAG TPA: hypothetical protein [Caudoviricetes sp.]